MDDRRGSGLTQQIGQGTATGLAAEIDGMEVELAGGDRRWAHIHAHHIEIREERQQAKSEITGNAGDEYRLPPSVHFCGGAG